MGESVALFGMAFVRVKSTRLFNADLEYNNK
jgi:hypothetical protein